MPAKFRRIAVLGVTAFGTWAVVPVAAPAADNPSRPPAHAAKAPPRSAVADAPRELRVVAVPK
jgi:hypothetical protein